MTLRTTARAGFTGTAALLTIGLVAAPSAHAATTPSDAASSYLAGQLKAGADHFSVSGYADYGLTIDGILALDSAGTAQSQAAASMAYVTKNAGNYYGTGTELYAGSLAKFIVATQASGGDASALVAKLKGREQANGQFTDNSQWGDYSNTVGQSWALIALKRAGSAPDAKAVAFLKQQQCSNGGFRLNYTGACTSDPDVTSFAVQALAAAGDTASIAKAATYLAGQQDASGGVRGGTSTTGANANSTGLAAVAFTLAGKSTNASHATTYVKSLQYGCSFPASVRGGIAYDASVFAATKAKGTAASADDKLNRSTAQAMLALTQQSYLTIKAGSTSAAPAIDCSVASPTSTSSTSPTPTATGTSTSSPTATGTSSAPSPTSSVTGPPVITDGPSSGDGFDLLPAAGVVGGIAAIGGAATLVLRRRR